VLFSLFFSDSPLDKPKTPRYIPAMADSGSPKPFAVAVLLALVLTAWCLASNSLETSSAHDPVAALEP
jgi:hypothetical protein